eukprot:GHVL01026416.1.p1 GENE.GHVL01026416.1~~GHVL01026416.1.p1  ORF type:complete len:217 (+),score=25.71 GHVL01026416.1:521-1171(+)
MYSAYTSFQDPSMSYAGQQYTTQQPYRYSSYGVPQTASYAVPQTTSYMMPNQASYMGNSQSFYPQYSSASFIQPAPYNPYDWSQNQQGQALQTQSFNNQATSRSGVKNTPTPTSRSSGKEAILVIKNIVNVPKSFGELGNGRYQVAAWCRNDDKDQNAIRKGYCTQLVSATASSSGDPRHEDANFNYAKIRVPWDGEEVIQIKVLTDETVQNYQKN